MSVSFLDTPPLVCPCGNSPALYCHYKGGKYLRLGEVLGSATDVLTPLTVYRSMEHPEKVYAQPQARFDEDFLLKEPNRPHRVVRRFRAIGRPIELHAGEVDYLFGAPDLVLSPMKLKIPAKWTTCTACNESIYDDTGAISTALRGAVRRLVAGG